MRKWFGRGYAAAAPQLSSIARISAEARAVTDSNGLVVFHAGTGRMFKANVVGARIWHGLEERRPAAALAKELAQQYGVPAERAEYDIARFTDELQKAGLLVGGAD